jgi:hypothetical protein
MYYLLLIDILSMSQLHKNSFFWRRMTNTGIRYKTHSDKEKLLPCLTLYALPAYRYQYRRSVFLQDQVLRSKLECFLN